MEFLQKTQSVLVSGTASHGQAPTGLRADGQSDGGHGGGER